MDILGDKMEEQYEKIKFNETPPYSDKFEGYGMDSLNFFKNSGSFFFYFGLIPFVVVVRFIINCLAVYYRKYETARKIGVMAYSNNKQQILILAMSKLVLETFTDLCLMTYL